MLAWGRTRSWLTLCAHLRSVFNVLKSWIESHFYEGEDDEELKRIKDFALDEMAQSLPMETPSKLLIRLVERKVGCACAVPRRLR